MLKAILQALEFFTGSVQEFGGPPRDSCVGPTLCALHLLCMGGRQFHNVRHQNVVKY